jgi:hypothetical protein
VKARRVSLARVSNLTIVLSALAAAIGGLTGIAHGWSVAIGGAFMLGNFHLLRLLVSLVMRPASGRNARAWAVVLLTLKLLLAVVLVAAVIYQFPVAPLSFALGASMLLIAALLEATVLGEEIGGPSADNDIVS